jgi:hypothetical protein
MRRIRSLLIVIALFALTGCAVLTPSQVAEVEKFAQATSAYSVMPNEVMKAHADLRSNVKIANASGSLSGESAWRLLEEAKNFRESVEPLANRAETACNVLKNYGNLLSVLAGDDYTAKLQASAEDFGRSLDSAILKYNKISGKSIGTFGGAAAAVVRGAGGLYIKHRQTTAIKQAVENAEPVVDEMADAISNLLKAYTDSKSGLRLIPKEKEDLIQWYKLKGYKGPLSTSRMVMEEILKADTAVNLAEQARGSIESLQAAHKELAEKLKSKMTLDSAIGTVQVFVGEVEAAKGLYEKLSKK